MSFAVFQILFVFYCYSTLNEMSGTLIQDVFVKYNTVLVSYMYGNRIYEYFAIEMNFYQIKADSIRLS